MSRLARLGVHYDGTVTARLDRDASGGKHIGAVAFTLFKPGLDCEWAYNQVVEGINSGRIETVAFGGTTFVHPIGVSFGGSGNGYTHFVLAPTQDGFTPAIASALKHSNMGSLHIGVLGTGYKPGLTIWDAIWNSGTHYDPHRCSVTFYPWSSTAFDASQRTATSFEVDAEPDALPVRLGWQGRDQTGQNRFARIVPQQSYLVCLNRLSPLRQLLVFRPQQELPPDFHLHLSVISRNI